MSTSRSFRALAVAATAAVVLGVAGNARAEPFNKQNFIRHAGASAAIGCGTILLTNSRPWAYGLTFAAGALKEYYDSRHPGSHSAEQVDFRDNAIGMVAGIEGCKAAFGKSSTDAADRPHLKLNLEPEAPSSFIVPMPMQRGVGVLVGMRF